MRSLQREGAKRRSIILEGEFFYSDGDRKEWFYWSSIELFLGYEEDEGKEAFQEDALKVKEALKEAVQEALEEALKEALEEAFQ